MTNTDYKMLFTKTLEGLSVIQSPRLQNLQMKNLATFSLQDINMKLICHVPLCALFVQSGWIHSTNPHFQKSWDFR